MQFITDDKGNKLSVVLTIEAYNNMLEQLEVSKNYDESIAKNHSLINGVDTSKALEIEKKANNKKRLLRELAGSWSDADNNIIDDIYESRNSSDKKIDLDY